MTEKQEVMIRSLLYQIEGVMYESDMHGLLIGTDTFKILGRVREHLEHDLVAQGLDKGFVKGKPMFDRHFRELEQQYGE